MQYLKDEVKENIIKAALSEFNENGYINASMRNIAKRAKITSGNIYRYFNSKEQLFNYIMQPVYDQLMEFVLKTESDILKFNVNYSNFDSMVFMKEIYIKILEVFSEHGTELLILLEKSENTKFSNTKQDLKKIIKENMTYVYMEELKRQGKTVKDELILSAIATSFVEGICEILKNTQDGERVKYLVESFAEITFHDLSKRI